MECAHCYNQVKKRSASKGGMAVRRPRLPHPGPLLRLPHLIRFRLTMWYTGLAALVLATFVGGVYYAFGQYQWESYTDLLKQTFQQQVNVGFRPSSPVTP